VRFSHVRHADSLSLSACRAAVLGRSFPLRPSVRWRGVDHHGMVAAQVLPLRADRQCAAVPGVADHRHGVGSPTSRLSTSALVTGCGRALASSGSCGRSSSEQSAATVSMSPRTTASACFWMWSRVVTSSIGASSLGVRRPPPADHLMPDQEPRRIVDHNAAGCASVQKCPLTLPFHRRQYRDQGSAPTRAPSIPRRGYASPRAAQACAVNRNGAVGSFSRQRSRSRACRAGSSQAT